MTTVEITSLSPLGVERVTKAYTNLSFMQRKIFDTYFKWTTEENVVIIEKRDKKNMNLLNPQMIAGSIKEHLLEDGLREEVDFRIIVKVPLE